jgi:cysteine desulfurase
MLPYFGERFGNAASREHSFGWEAEKAVERARKLVADLAGATPQEIVFTSGATESDNLAIRGVLDAYRDKGNHVVTMASEHKAVLDPVKNLERSRYHATVLKPQPDGLLDVAGLKRALRADTVLVSVMWANNEIGVIQPVCEVGALCRREGVLFHCDAAQAFGKVPVDVYSAEIDLMSVSAHKMYGPKGIGALFVRRRNPQVRLVPQVYGGGHEFGMRSGTLNVPAIVGFGKAASICLDEMARDTEHVRELRDHLQRHLEANLDQIYVNGSMEHRLPGNLNVSFTGVDAEALLMSLPDVAVSTGSACKSATIEPSHVLKALGLSDDMASSAVRFGFGRFNTKYEADYVARSIVESVRRLRALSPTYGTGAART